MEKLEQYRKTVQDMLLKRGNINLAHGDKEDIVLRLQAPEFRKFTDYAVG